MGLDYDTPAVAQPNPQHHPDAGGAKQHLGSRGPQLRDAESVDQRVDPGSLPRPERRFLNNPTSLNRTSDVPKLVSLHSAEAMPHCVTPCSLRVDL
jgi:hypothetical protein